MRPVSDWTLRSAITALRARTGVLTSWASLGRIAGWVVIWCLVLSAVFAPSPTRYTDRAHPPDVPASNVRYVGPISRADLAGFVPPPTDPEAFTVAWIGGSEVKLRDVSVPGEFSQRVGAVGGRPMEIDSFNLIAPRLIDAIRAFDSARSAGADAVVISLNPAWLRTEWSVRGWPSLDVANLDSLWQQSSTWSWAMALTGPDDYAWRAAREAFGLVDAQTELNERVNDLADSLDVLRRPAPAAEDDLAGGDPRLPPGSALWLVDEYGPVVMLDEDDRVGALISGIGISQHEARFFADLLIDLADDAEIPVFLYAAPFSPESLADPDFAVPADEVEQWWAARAEQIESPLVQLESRSMSRDYPSAGTFFNNVHMSDAGPFADHLVPILCAQWAAADPALECS